MFKNNEQKACIKHSAIYRKICNQNPAKYRSSRLAMNVFVYPSAAYPVEQQYSHYD